MNKTFPILYKRTATGATQIWRAEVEADKFRVTSGQLDGKQVMSSWTVCEGKNLGKANETSPHEQAVSEAQSKWDKKAKTGYTQDIEKIDTCTKYVKPMLAKKLLDRLDEIDWKKGVLVQNKFNGVRCVATSESGVVLLKSRQGEVWISVPHINKDLQKFFAKYPNAVLDGELFNNELRERLNELNSIASKKKQKELTPELLKQSEEMVRFYVYDGYDFDGKTGPKIGYEIRKDWIDTSLPKFSTYFRSVKTDLVHSMAEVDEIFFKYVADGQEGIIVRIPNSAYKNNRSSDLLKHKPVDSDEGIILSLSEGTGNWADTAKTATIKWKGKVFDATFKGSYALGEERLKNPTPWIKLKVTFLYNGLTGLGTPNFARIDPNNCFVCDR